MGCDLCGDVIFNGEIQLFGLVYEKLIQLSFDLHANLKFFLMKDLVVYSSNSICKQFRDKKDVVLLFVITYIFVLLLGNFCLQ